MGKSNKFDYSNRPNSGVKLGHIISNALEKEAEKLAQKARKESGGSVLSSSDAKESVTHHLDLKAPGKHLGDEGVCALTIGLESALNKRTSTANLALVDLNLSDNDLTTMSLAQLAPIIHLARHDLKTIDLSQNAIAVETESEAVEWETFLAAFRDCSTIRRIDLSDNSNLGVRALEILARVHGREPAIHAVPIPGNPSMEFRASDSDIAEGDSDDDINTTIPARDERMTRLARIKRHCGLRSIPYLSLKSIGLTDAGALWLSYLLEYHQCPEQLIAGLNSICEVSSIKLHQQAVRSHGVDWSDQEPGLGKDGLQVLQKAEIIRQQSHFREESSAIDAEVDERDSTNSHQDDELTNHRGMEKHMNETGASNTHANARAARGHRRCSMLSSQVTEEDHSISDLERLRKKVQRAIISHSGASSVELWRCALKVVVSSRILAVISAAEPMSCGDSASQQNMMGTVRLRRDSKNDVDKSGSSSSNSNAIADVPTQSTTIFGLPEQRLTELTNSRRSLAQPFYLHRKDVFDERPNISELSIFDQTLSHNMPNSIKPRSHDYMQWQCERQQRVQPVCEPAIFPNPPSRFPLTVSRRIVHAVLSRREQTIMAPEQWERAFAWGADRANFARREHEWQRLGDSAQALMLLECIGCTAYRN